MKMEKTNISTYFQFKWGFFFIIDVIGGFYDFEFSFTFSIALWVFTYMQITPWGSV